MATTVRSVSLSAGEEEGAVRPASPAPLVLVVEDHEDTRFLLRYMLEARGYRVAEAGNGEEGVELVGRIHPDLILMDGSLPRLDGIAATRRIRELPSGARVPIIFLSGHAEPAFRAVAFEAGCDEYLTKPLDFGRLEMGLGRYADGRATARV